MYALGMPQFKNIMFLCLKVRHVTWKISNKICDYEFLFKDDNEIIHFYDFIKITSSVTPQI